MWSCTRSKERYKKELWKLSEIFQRIQVESIGNLWAKHVHCYAIATMLLPKPSRLWQECGTFNSILRKLSEFITQWKHSVRSTIIHFQFSLSSVDLLVSPIWDHPILRASPSRYIDCWPRTEVGGIKLAWRGRLSPDTTEDIVNTNSKTKHEKSMTKSL